MFFLYRDIFGALFLHLTTRNVNVILTHFQVVSRLGIPVIVVLAVSVFQIIEPVIKK